MKVTILKNEIIKINLGEKECSLIVKDKVFIENVSALNIAMVGAKYDKKFRNSFIRNVYKRCIGIGGIEYKMCIDYSFEI